MSCTSFLTFTDTVAQNIPAVAIPKYHCRHQLLIQQFPAVEESHVERPEDDLQFWSGYFLGFEKYWRHSCRFGALDAGQ